MVPHGNGTARQWYRTAMVPHGNVSCIQEKMMQLVQSVNDVSSCLVSSPLVVLLWVSFSFLSRLYIGTGVVGMV
jgi:hypothetical protein